MGNSRSVPTVPMLALAAVKNPRDVFADTADTFTVNDPSGSCYSFQKVAASNIVVFHVKDWSATPTTVNDIAPPLLFCSQIPFVIMNYNAFQGNAGAAAGLTENLVPGNASPPPLAAYNDPNVWYYSFCAGANDSILISACPSTMPETQYWLYFLPSAGPAASGQVISQISPSKAEVEDMGVHFGIIGGLQATPAPAVLPILISYYDNNTKVPCFVSALASNFHGLDASAANAASCVQYASSSMTVTSLSCPAFAAALYWEFVAAPFTSTQALQYMTQTCVGSSTNCINGAPSCTLFNSTNAQGAACRAVASVADPAIRDRAYAAACNMNYSLGITLQAKVPDSLTGAMQSQDCSCINYSQSTYGQPSLPAHYNFSQFEAWLLSNGLPSGDSGNVMCWWPSCQTAGGGPANNILQYSNMSSITGKCPNTLTCINDIMMAVLDKTSDVVAVAKTSCSQNPPASTPSTSPSGAVPVPVPESSTSRFLHSTIFKIAVVLVVFLFFLVILFIILKPAKRNIQYVVV